MIATFHGYPYEKPIDDRTVPAACPMKDTAGFSFSPPFLFSVHSMHVPRSRAASRKYRFIASRPAGSDDGSHGMILRIILVTGRSCWLASARCILADFLVCEPASRHQSRVLFYE